MKNIYICILFLNMINIIIAQDNNCSGYYSDANYYRYTASGYQDVIDGNHSKAKNESYKMANITAMSELAKIVSSMVTRVIETMTLEDGNFFIDMSDDTTLVSSYKVFNDIRTVCRSETKLINNTYVTYVTKEIALDDISNMYQFNNDNDKKRFRKLLENNNIKQ